MTGDGPNAYLYAHANPITIVDPTGTSGLGAAFTAGELLALGGFALAGMGIIAIGSQQNRHARPPPIHWPTLHNPFAGPVEAPPIDVPIPTAPPVTTAPPSPPPRR